MSYQDGLFNIGGGGGGGGLDYSTSEQDTGQLWIDAEPIYQKTIDCGAGQAAGGATTDAHGITGLDKVLKVEGFAWQSSSDSSAPVPRIGTGTNYIDLYVDDTNINLTFGAGQDWSTFNIWVTLWYTKD